MKSKLNWRYVNILVLLLIIYMVYVLSPLWGSIFSRIFYAFLPIIIAFIVAFIFNPLISYVERKIKIPRIIIILLIYTILIAFVLFVVFVLVKPYLEELGNLSLGLSNLLEQIGVIFNIDTTSIQQQSVEMLNSIYGNILNFFTATGDGADMVFNVVLSAAVIVIVGIIFLVNFETIVTKAKTYLQSKNNTQVYNYVSTLYHGLTNYIVAEIIIAVVQFIEYAGLFLLIGIFIPEYRTYALVLGVTVSLFSLIPYFGGYISSFFMILIALSLPNAIYAAIPIAIFIVIFPNLDAYLINPHIYKKQLKLNPLFSITAMLLSQAFFGIIGVVLSIPVIIVITITYEFYKTPIKAKLKQFKESV